MLTYADVRNSLILRKLILISLCEIYKDIIPSYKIRAWTDKEQEQNVGKDVKTLREYEETLCRQYKLYIDYISDSIKEMNKHMRERDRTTRESWKHYGIVCIGCLSSLLETKSHFNFTPDIIEIITQQLTHKVPEIAKLAGDSVRKLYREDKTLQLSLDITQKVTKLLKQRSYGVRSEVLDIFLALRLKEIVLVEENEKKKMSHKEKQQMSRNDRKVCKVNNLTLY
jgi:nucleolar complex protein 3